MFGIHFDRHTFGNLLKNVSPAAGLLGPGGIALAGGMSALGDLGRGKNIGQSLGGSIGNMALAGGASAAKSHMGQLKGLFSPGSGGGASTPGATGMMSNGNGGYIGYGAEHAPDAGGMSNPLAGLGHALSGAGNFAAKNPQAIGMGLQGIGNMASAGSENRLRDAQASRLETQNQLDLDEQAAQKRRAEALAPFLQSLIGQAQQRTQWQPPPNPYGVGQ